MYKEWKIFVQTHTYSVCPSASLYIYMNEWMNEKSDKADMNIYFMLLISLVF